jgi:hypothetical protein
MVVDVVDVLLVEVDVEVVDVLVVALVEVVDAMVVVVTALSVASLESSERLLHPAATTASAMTVTHRIRRSAGRVVMAVSLPAPAAFI